MDAKGRCGVWGREAGKVAVAVGHTCGGCGEGGGDDGWEGLKSAYSWSFWLEQEGTGGVEPDCYFGGLWRRARKEVHSEEDGLSCRMGLRKTEKGLDWDWQAGLKGGGAESPPLPHTLLARCYKMQNVPITPPRLCGDIPDSDRIRTLP